MYFDILKGSAIKNNNIAGIIQKAIIGPAKTFPNVVYTAICLK